jgi:serine protease AprX
VALRLWYEHNHPACRWLLQWSCASTLVKTGTSSPSAALIKALLINGAVELVGQYAPTEAGPSPNNSSGFSRVNLGNSVIIPGKIPGQIPKAGFLECKFNRGGEKFTTYVKNPGKVIDAGLDAGASTATFGVTFKVSFDWSGFPGPMLQNDFDLIVKAADGTY